MSTLGIIFSHIHDKEVFEVTRSRTISSAPVAGRYRLIDFPLSNMVNNGIHNIGVVTKNNYQSLMDHVGSGKEWDLARKTGGLVILPPYSAGDSVYNTRLEALKSIINFINNSKAEYVVLTDCYHICNIDYRPIFEQHFATGADITCVYRKCNITNDDYMPINVFTCADDGRIEKMDIRYSYIGEAEVSIDTWIMKRELLQALVMEAFNTNARSFNRDILKENLENLKVYGYRFNGYFGNISSLQTYYKINMDLLDKSIRDELFNKQGHSIYTKVRDSAPTRYGNDCHVANSLIADGCIIEGTVENSVIFRDAVISKGAVVKNSILMQGTVVAPHTTVEYAVTDKNVKIIHKKEVKGDENKPVYIKKDGVI